MADIFELALRLWIIDSIWGTGRGDRGSRSIIRRLLLMCPSLILLCALLLLFAHCSDICRLRCVAPTSGIRYDMLIDRFLPMMMTMMSLRLYGRWCMCKCPSEVCWWKDRLILRSMWVCARCERLVHCIRRQALCVRGYAHRNGSSLMLVALSVVIDTWGMVEMCTCVV
jgi:hypothetical protein